MPSRDRVMGIIRRLLIGAAVGVAMAVTAYLCAWINMRNAMGYRWTHERAFNQLGELKTILEKFQQQAGRYPENLAELKKTPPQYTLIDDSGEIRDPWGNPYQYHAEGKGYSLFSLGRDGRRGGEGLDQDLDVDDLSRGGGRQSWQNTVGIPTLRQFTFECGTRPDAVDMCACGRLCLPGLPESLEKGREGFLEIVTRTGFDSVSMLLDRHDDDRITHSKPPLISCVSYTFVTRCSLPAWSSISSIGGFSRGSGMLGLFMSI